MRSPGGSSYDKVVMRSSHGAKMDGVPAAVATKVTPRKTAAINEGVALPRTGGGNPMAGIKEKSQGKNGGTLC